MMNNPHDPALTDDELINALPGFTNGYAEVNGTRLHYVEGGQGHPLVLLPGWPETWWAYHKVMPLLAAHYRLIVVDLRGMGSSDKPVGGYDKKTMAEDVAQLIDRLGHRWAYLAGHDIGAHVAFAMAANHPSMVAKLILLDTPHPDPGMYRLPMLPALGQPPGTFPWWVAFNQIPQLPEQLLAGQYDQVLNWVFDHLLLDKEQLSTHDRAVYRAAYDTSEGIRAGNGWYQAFPQDIADSQIYAKVTLPVLGIGGSGYDLLAQALPQQATNFRLEKVADSGHFILAEQPQQTVEYMRYFLG